MKTSSKGELRAEVSRLHLELARALEEVEVLRARLISAGLDTVGVEPGVEAAGCSASAASVAVEEDSTPVSRTSGGVAWSVVAGGTRSVAGKKNKSKVILSNRFAPLQCDGEMAAVDSNSTAAVQDEDCQCMDPVISDKKTKGSTEMRTRSVLLTGDSNVRRFDRWAVPAGAAREKVSVACFPGAGIQDVAERIRQMVRGEAADEVLVVHHVGVNDVCRLSSGAVLRKIAELVHTTKAARPGVNVRICSIPERLDRGQLVNEKARTINSKLVDICSASGAQVIDWRAAINFRTRGKWTNDGVHFDRRASQVVGMKVGEFIHSFLG